MTNQEIINVIARFFSDRKEIDRLVQELMRAYGSDINRDVVIKYLNEFDLDYTEFSSYAAVDTVTKINTTLIDRVNQYLKSALASMTLMTILDEELTKNIFLDISKIFKESMNNSMTIARTQSNMWAGDVLQKNYAANGVEYKEWVTTMDGRERPSHAAIDGEIVRMNELFSNGCIYPTDPSCPYLEEIINCRCVHAPVL